MSQYRSLQVPEELCQRAEEWIDGRFENLEALVCFTLQELLRTDARKLDHHEEEMIQQRLKDLGYI